MADKKKMSVADILAAARKQDGKGGAAAEPAGETPAPEPAAPVESAPEEVAAPESSNPEPAAKPAKPKPAAAAAGGRPNVADILAAARANKGAPAAAAKPAAAKPAAKPATAKPAAEKAVEKPAKAPAAASGIRDTASILASARGGAKPGPMSKAEAAARLKPAPAAPEKAKPSVPPMPVKPESVRSKPAKAAKESAAVEPEERRWFLATGFVSLAATLGMWTLGTARFMFPNVLIEPPSKFKVGFPSDFSPGAVEEKFKAQFGVWVVNGEYQGQREIYALKSVCTHLGCTPNWLEAEQKFKCPCHGSGFYKDGINFEGPAPRPLERYAIRLADDGQLEIDKSKVFQEEMGQWKEAASFVPV